LGYTGSQPSIIRRAVALLPDKEITILVDLGCGKGRVLAVASEFPFREIIGVELSDTVAAIAEANMAVIRRNFPSRSPIQVVTGDAVEYPFPDAPLAIFLYNPFDEPLMRRLLTRIEAVLEQREQPITVIYYNPVSGAVLDASPWLIRAHALSLHCDESEEGFAPTATDSVVIWQDRRHASKPSAEALRKIVQVEPGIRVELAPAESTDQDPISASGIQPL
jgi:SAM-dependent methyltransferase